MTVISRNGTESRVLTKTQSEVVMYEILTFHNNGCIACSHEDTLAEAAVLAKEISLIYGYTSIWSFKTSDMRTEYFTSELMNEFTDGLKVWEPDFNQDSRG